MSNKDIHEEQTLEDLMNSADVQFEKESKVAEDEVQ